MIKTMFDFNHNYFESKKREWLRFADSVNVLH